MDRGQGSGVRDLVVIIISFAAGSGLGDGFDGCGGRCLVAREGLRGDLQTPEELAGAPGADARGDYRRGDLRERLLNGGAIGGDGKPEVVPTGEPGRGVTPGVEVAEDVTAECGRLALEAVGFDMAA